MAFSKSIKQNETDEDKAFEAEYTGRNNNFVTQDLMFAMPPNRCFNFWNSLWSKNTPTYVVTYYTQFLVSKFAQEYIEEKGKIGYGKMLPRLRPALLTVFLLNHYVA